MTVESFAGIEMTQELVLHNGFDVIVLAGERRPRKRRPLAKRIASNLEELHYLRADTARICLRRLWQRTGSRIGLKIGSVLSSLGPKDRDRYFSDLWQLQRAHPFHLTVVESLNSEACAQVLSGLKPDLLVIASAPLLDSGIFSVPRIGTLNFHCGLVPEYRGQDTIFWALYNGDPVGYTIHFVDEGVDSGPVVAREVVPADLDKDIDEIFRAIVRVAARRMVDAVRAIERGSLKAMAQDESIARRYRPPNRAQQYEFAIRMGRRRALASAQGLDRDT